MKTITITCDFCRKEILAVLNEDQFQHDFPEMTAVFNRYGYKDFHQNCAINNNSAMLQRMNVKDKRA